MNPWRMAGTSELNFDHMLLAFANRSISKEQLANQPISLRQIQTTDFTLVQCILHASNLLTSLQNNKDEHPDIVIIMSSSMELGPDTFTRTSSVASVKMLYHQAQKFL